MHAALELKAPQEALEEDQKQARRLEGHMKENWKNMADLLLLEYKREACLRELPKAEEELSSQYGVLQAEGKRT
ncbi:hypothetical protein lerEdw1_019850 [Lerista edwardsae]|nr:hypothetical protein lerEdw1_019850 [Lerista edwardsae]